MCTTAPTVVSWGSDRLDVFLLGTDSALYHKWWDGSNWGPSVTGYEYMAGNSMSPPQVVAWGKDRLDVFVLGTNTWRIRFRRIVFFSSGAARGHSRF